jgi:AraC-like DNA-binding protein
MSRGDPLFIFRLCPVVLRLLALSPEKTRELLLRCGLPESAAVGTCTAPLSRFRQLMDEASLLYEGPLGIDLALAAPEGTYDTAELLVRTASTLGRGLFGLARYASLINPVGRFSLEEQRGELALHYFVPGSPDALGAHLNEYTIAYVIHALRRVVTAPLALRSVWFPQRREGHPKSLERHFECPVKLSAPTSGFSIDARAAALPLRTSDPVVFSYLERQAEERLDSLGRRSFAAVVVDAIENQVGFGQADLPKVARTLGATARTVQRHLEDEGTSFREVVDEARRRRAESLLGSGATSPSVAEALGFSDTRSFRRAFRRWTENEATSPGAAGPEASERRAPGASRARRTTNPRKSR